MHVYVGINIDYARMCVRVCVISRELNRSREAGQTSVLGGCV